MTNLYNHCPLTRVVGHEAKGTPCRSGCWLQSSATSNSMTTGLDTTVVEEWLPLQTFARATVKLSVVVEGKEVRVPSSVAELLFQIKVIIPIVISNLHRNPWIVTRRHLLIQWRRRYSTSLLGNRCACRRLFDQRRHKACPNLSWV